MERSQCISLPLLVQLCWVGCICGAGNLSDVSARNQINTRLNSETGPDQRVNRSLFSMVEHADAVLAEERSDVVLASYRWDEFELEQSRLRRMFGHVDQSEWDSTTSSSTPSTTTTSGRLCDVCMRDRHVEVCGDWPVGTTSRPCYQSIGTLSVMCRFTEDGRMAYRVTGECDGPDYPPPDLYCQMGKECAWTIAGAGMRGSSMFAIKDGPCNSTQKELLRVPIHDGRYIYGTRRQVEVDVRLGLSPALVGIKHLCWAPDRGSMASVEAAVTHIGPYPDSSYCVLGAPCQLDMTLQNPGMMVGDTLEGDSIAVVDKTSTDCTGFVDLGDAWTSGWQEVSKPIMGTVTHRSSVGFGTASGGEMVGEKYNLCWKDTNQGGIYSLGAWGILGPSPQDISPECLLGIPCDIAVEGYLLATIEDQLLLCAGYQPEMLAWSPAVEEDSAANFTVNFFYASEGRTQEPLCWKSKNGEAFQVGTITLVNECPKPSNSWPDNKDSTITLPAGKSQSFLYVSSTCSKGSKCESCIEASSDGALFNASGYFVLADDEMEVRSCSDRLVCAAKDCMVNLAGTPTVVTGSGVTGTAYVNRRYKCQQTAKVTVVAFGCQEHAVTTFMGGVALVLLATVIVGLTLEAIAKASVKTALEGSVEVRCTGKEYPSFVALKSCVTQSVAPDLLQWFDAWSSGSVVFARFRLPSKAKPVRHWVTEVPGLCRVDAASMHEVRQPGRLPGAGLLELAEACAAGCNKKGRNEEEKLHFEFAVALLQRLRKPHMQVLLFMQYVLMITTAVGLPIIAGHMMEQCSDGYPVFLHAMWGVFILLQAYFQWRLISRSCPDGELSGRFIRNFSLRLFAGWCVGVVSQTDMYMDLTFPVIAKSCNFELWVVATWLCALGIGIGQVGQSIAVIFLGRLRARRAVSPERRERAELSVLFFLLRATDNVALCFAVRPALDQRLGGASSWAARVAEARVPTARFIFEDVEQSALQVIFLVFFDVATPSDVVWIALSITTSLLLSLLLMVQVLPEVRDWIWYRLLAVVRRRFRIPLLFAVFIIYRFVATAPWLYACSRFVGDTTIFGVEVRDQVLQEALLGVLMTTASLAVCCIIIYFAWKAQVTPPPEFQPPLYDAEARFSPKAFGAWSTEQDEWLEPLRTCMAKEADPKHRSAIERLDNELFKLRHGLSNKVQAVEALEAGNIPDTLARCGRWVLSTAQLRDRVQELLKDRRFTRARLETKSQMIDNMANEALSTPEAGKVSKDSFFRLLPYGVLKNGIPRSSDGKTVNVSEARKQAGSRRIAVIGVSHCWLHVDSTPPHPDNEALDKARSLTNFAEWYIQHWGNNIEVFFWIDYSCIDQDNRDVSVALLPVLIASCTAMVLWRTQDYETRSWTAMERVLAYSYCEGGLTPYVIDAQFTNCGQKPRWEPRKLPDPLTNGKTTMVMNASDKHFVQQLLQCVFSVPAFEVFPDRQSISFGQTEVVHLDLTIREPLRSADTAADGFVDGIDKRIWLAAADKPPAVNIGMRVRTKDQVALLMPADVADTFVPIVPIGDSTDKANVTPVDFPSIVEKFDGLLASGTRPTEMDVGLLLEVLQNELTAAMRAKDEARIMNAVETSQRFTAFPPAALEARRQLCRPRLQAALKGSDRILQHALQLAQQYGVDTHDFPEFRSAAAEQDKRRATQLRSQLEGQMQEADRTRDDVLMYAVWQAASKAAALDSGSDVFVKLTTEALKCIEAIMVEKFQAPGVSDDAEQLHNLLDLAKTYGVEKNEEIEAARETYSVMVCDVERIQDAITFKMQQRGIDDVQTRCESVVQSGAALWILHPLLEKILEWGKEQAADELQESLRAVTLMGMDKDDPAFQAAVDKLKEMMKEGLPDDWDILRREWSQAHLAVQRVKVEDVELNESVQALFDSTMIGHKVGTADRFGTAPTRMKVKQVVRVRHPGNYLRYKTCRAKMMESIQQKEGVQELGSVKTDVAAYLPGLLDMRELSSEINEVILFHGTSYAGAEGISADGFRMDMSGSWVGSMFGRGAYFAERVLKSDEYAGCGHGRRDACCNTERPILICRVLLGKFNYDDEPCPNSGRLESSCLYGDCDSILADREAANIKRGRNPTFREFVVFDKDQVYPEYVVWYTRCYHEKMPKNMPLLERAMAEQQRVMAGEEEPISDSPAGAADPDPAPDPPDTTAGEEFTTI